MSGGNPKRRIPKARIDGRDVRIYPAAGADAADAPVVYTSMVFEVGRQVVKAAAQLGCPPFSLVSVSHLRWDEDLSPWPSEPVVSKDDHFTGEADAYARWHEETLVPYAEGELGIGPGSFAATHRVLAGYSMSGLFALYAPYVVDAFWGSVSGSGSVWFPGFLDYVRAHRFLRKPGAIYLSLGDRESSVKNPALQRTETISRELCTFYQQQGIESVFELNPGDHYRDADTRLAKGIRWILAAVREQGL